MVKKIAVFLFATGFSFAQTIVNEVKWTSDGTVRGVNTNYTPIVLTSSTGISIYTTALSQTVLDGQLLRQTGTWTSVGTGKVVMSSSQVTDVTNPYIRTTAIVKGPSGAYYGLIHVGSGYPSSNGFRPAWATSPDGVNWTYHGMITLNNYFAPYVLASSGNLIVNESITELNTAVPADNRYIAWEDAYCFTGLMAGSGSNCPRLTMIYSADGEHWFTANDPATGEPLDVIASLVTAGELPAAQTVTATSTNGSKVLTGIASTAGIFPNQYVTGAALDSSGGAVVVSRTATTVTLSQPATISGSGQFAFGGFGGQFSAAVQTPYGYHLIAADTFPSDYLTHFFSCDAIHWSILETNSAVFNFDWGKGTNLVYNSSTKTVHALSSGPHYSYVEKAFACPAQ